MIKVYIASAYTLGDKTANVLKSLNCADELMTAGFVPFAPLLFHFQHIVFSRPEEDWMALDIEWLSVCDALIRLPGESTSADQEMEYARENSIPVFYNINQLIEYYTDEQH